MSKHAYVKAFPKELREQVVKLVQVGDRSPLEVAHEFGISVDSVRAVGSSITGNLLQYLRSEVARERDA